MDTRFLPATKASAKEMLPVVDKPLIQYAVEEANAAGVRQMIFVTGLTKCSAQDHFDTAYDPDTELEMAGKTALLDVTRGIAPDDMLGTYVLHPLALGLGHAVLCAKELVTGKPLAQFLAEALMVGRTPIITQMFEQFSRWRRSIMAVQDVPSEHTRRYGIVSGSAVEDGVVAVTGIVAP